MSNKKQSYLALPNESALAKVSYIRLLAFAAEKAAGVGFEKNWKNGKEVGFSLADLKNDERTNVIADAWLRELLLSVCTVRSSSGGDEISDLKASQITDDHRFVIKADEYLRYSTLIELDHMNDLLEETRDTGVITRRNLLVAFFAVVVAIGIPFSVVHFTTSSVNVVEVSLDKESIDVLQRAFVDHAPSKASDE